MVQYTGMIRLCCVLFGLILISICLKIEKLLLLGGLWAEKVNPSLLRLSNKCSENVVFLPLSLSVFYKQLMETNPRG